MYKAIANIHMHMRISIIDNYNLNMKGRDYKIVLKQDKDTGC